MTTLIHNVSQEAYYARTIGLLSPAFHQRRVVAVGCGAGSYFLEKLARLGPAEIHLIDPDRVEIPNLARTAYALADVGCLKVEALAAHIRMINPFVTVSSYARDICTFTDAERDQLLAGTDLLIAGTDFFPAQALLNTWSQQAYIPIVFIGIHEQAQGGRIIWTVPGATPCYRCIAQERYVSFAEAGTAQTDLAGAHGLLVDIQFIDTIALKISAALLERGQESALGRFFSAMGRRNEITVRMSPEYGYGAQLWDALLSDLPATPKPYAQELKDQILLAMDTIWLATEYLAGCPDCGTRQPEAHHAH